MQSIAVTKCQATGNDFVLVDGRAESLAAHGQLARYLCDRHFGIGADGLLVISESDDPRADLSMQIFNPDGSEAEMCGNGIRCLALCVFAASPRKRRLAVQTLAGLIETSIIEKDGKSSVRVIMNPPAFLDFPSRQHAQRLLVGDEEAVAYVVSMGNPHVPVFVRQSVDGVDLEVVAQQVARWSLFPVAPNVELAQATPSGLVMRVHERGVGETLGCGTGACAVAVTAIETQRAQSPLKVSSRGGSVQVEWSGPGDSPRLTGDAEIVFQTQINVPGQIAATEPV